MSSNSVATTSIQKNQPINGNYGADLGHIPSLEERQKRLMEEVPVFIDCISNLIDSTILPAAVLNAADNKSSIEVISLY